MTAAVFDRVAWPVHTARLVIRPATSADLLAVFEIRALPEVAEWMPGWPTSYAEFVLRSGQHDVLARS
jgi:RimJ/RimL family protein N-acetyltransferase